MNVGGIDLRSDTVTRPTAAMLRAMTSAPLGDDVFGDDPTVNRLQEVAADRMGKEAALFVASGTMGNLLGLLVNAGPGQEVIADADSHVFMNEAAGAAMVGGVQIRQVPTDRGVLSPQQVAAVLRPADDDHQPVTAAIMIENTHNRHGGVAWTLPEVQRVSQLARRHGLAVHMDGARIFNAATATGVDAKAIAAASTPACRMPPPSILRHRRACLIFPAGLVALETMTGRLADDHRNARTLAEGLAELPGVVCDLTRVQTNIVYFQLKRLDSASFLAACAQRGLLGGAPSPDQVRFVTHHGISGADIGRALAICQQVLGDGA